MNTKIFKETFNLNDKDLSYLFNIPIRTIENWDYRNSMPDYVFGMMNEILCRESHRIVKDLLIEVEFNKAIRFCIDNEITMTLPTSY